MLSAYQARRMMTNEKATKLVEYILSGIPARAKKGHYDIIVGCPLYEYSEHDIKMAEEQLKKLGYDVSRGLTINAIWFFVNWREQEKESL